MSKLSVVIPCYNEAANIPLIFVRLKEALVQRRDVEVILVDNGSTDDSAEVFRREIGSADERFRLKTLRVNEGYGHGIMQGLEAASGDILAWTHADMQTDPKDVLLAFDRYRTLTPGKYIVKGRRKNRRVLETIFTFGMKVVASSALGVKLDDVNAQPKLFSRAFYADYIRDTAPKDFSLDLFLLYQALKNDFTIVTIPVIFAKRLNGEAKGGGSWRTRIKLIRRTFSYIFALRRTLLQKEATHADR